MAGTTVARVEGHLSTGRGPSLRISRVKSRVYNAFEITGGFVRIESWVRTCTHRDK